MLASAGVDAGMLGCLEVCQDWSIAFLQILGNRPGRPAPAARPGRRPGRQYEFF